MLIFAAIILVYTFLGGFKAVCWTDFFQGLLMLVAVLAVPIIAAGSGDANPDFLGEVYTYTEAGKTVTCVFVGTPFEATWQDIASGLAWGLGYFGMPHILVRFMSIKKAKDITKAATIAIIWVTLALGAVIVLAILGRMIMGPELIESGNQSLVFVEMAKKFFHPFLAGVLMAAIIAASMSTADSQLLVASSSFTSDIYKPVLRKKASDKEALWVGRLIVLVVAVVAYFIASSKSQGAQAIMNLVENAWAGFGSSFGPVVLLALFWKRLTYKGALAGVIGGALVDVIWLATGLSASTGIYEIIPGFAAGLVFSVVVTLIDKKPSEETLAVFEAATAAEE